MSHTAIGLRHYKRLLLSLCAGLALAVFTPAVRYAGAQEAPAAEKQATGKKPSEPDEIWTAAVPRLKRALRESNDAMTARIAKLDEFFAERKEGARPFAEAVLSLEGKARAAAGLGERAVGGLAELFGEKRPAGPDSFTLYVRDCFRKQVLDPAKVKQAVEEAVAGYVGDATEIEGRLLVDLKADIDDQALDLHLTLPRLRAEAAAGANCDAVIGETLDAAAKDLGVSLGMFVASNYIGNKVADRITPDNTSNAGKLLVNILAGIGVDQLMDQAARGVGYDPQKEVTARTTAGIDRIRSLVVEGDPDAVKYYNPLFTYREGHPGAAVRDACRQAIEALERSANLGLRVRLVTLHNERSRQRTTALVSHIFGREAAQTPVRLLPAIDATKGATPESIILWAKSVTNQFGGTKP